MAIDFEQYYTRRQLFKLAQTGIEYGAAGAGAALYVNGSMNSIGENPLFVDPNKKEGTANFIAGAALLTVSPAFSIDRSNDLTRRNVLFMISAGGLLFYGPRILDGLGRVFGRKKDPIKNITPGTISQEIKRIIPPNNDALNTSSRPIRP